MSRVIHFEIPVDDAARAQEFYRAVFGWNIPDSGEGYWPAGTGDERDPGINGALIRRGEMHQAPVVVVAVDSLSEVVVAAREAGADILLERHEIPGVGLSGYIRDLDGNVVGLFEAADVAQGQAAG